MSVALIHYDAARKALVLARTTDEVKKIKDQSEMMRLYAQQIDDKQMEIDAAEIRIRAVRRLGELIKQQKETVGLNRGAKGSTVTGSKREPLKDSRPTLAEAGIDKKLSSQAQKMASISEKQFETHIAEWRTDQQSKRKAVSLRLSPARSKPSPPPVRKKSRSDEEADLVSEALEPARQLSCDWPQERSLRHFIHEVRQLLKHLERVEELRHGKISA